MSAEEIPYAGARRRGTFTPAGPERATARVELSAGRVVEADVGHPRLQAAAPRRQRLPRLRARRVHDAARHRRTGRCTCGSTSNGSTRTRPPRSTAGRDGGARRQIVHDVFDAFESGSIQQLIYRIGTRDARRHPDRWPRCTSRRTTARGIRSPSAATSSASTPTRARPTAASA